MIFRATASGAFFAYLISITASSLTADDQPKTPAPKSQATNFNGTSSTKCNPAEYVQHGYCQKYVTCNRKSRFEIRRGCSDGLFWNPAANSIHGGVCDYLRNLNSDTLSQYKQDKFCVLDIPYFRIAGECNSKYFYSHPIRTGGMEQEQTCPEGLLFSMSEESCNTCDQVKKKDGSTPCCTTPPDEDY